MIKVKEEYTLIEAAYALGRSAEYVRQRMPPVEKVEGSRIRNQTLTHRELMRIALPNLDVPIPHEDEERMYSLQEIVELLS